MVDLFCTDISRILLSGWFVFYRNIRWNKCCRSNWGSLYFTFSLCVIAERVNASDEDKHKNVHMTYLICCGWYIYIYFRRCVLLLWLIYWTHISDGSSYCCGWFILHKYYTDRLFAVVDLFYTNNRWIFLLLWLIYFTFTRISDGSSYCCGWFILHRYQTDLLIAVFDIFYTNIKRIVLFLWLNNFTQISDGSHCWVWFLHKCQTDFLLL